MKGSLFSSEVAEPYAQALMSLAQSNNIVDRFADDSREIIRVLEESPDLQALIINPTIGEPEKKRVLGEVIGKDVDGYLEKFLMLLVDKKRLMFLEPICQQYLALWRKLTSTVLAEVTAARDLNDDQRDAITDKVKQLTNAESVELNISIDPDIIGGVIIRVGSEVYDTSLRGQLRRLSLNLGR
ncbi:MAG: ATP synthase F1 subunit delta [Microcystaceae cyanobacterium]